MAGAAGIVPLLLVLADSMTQVFDEVETYCSYFFDAEAAPGPEAAVESVPASDSSNVADDEAPAGTINGPGSAAAAAEEEDVLVHDHAEVSTRLVHADLTTRPGDVPSSSDATTSSTSSSSPSTLIGTGEAIFQFFTKLLY